MALSERGQYTLSFVNPVAKFWGMYMANRYHEQDNPEGIMNLGVAESTLNSSLLVERLNQPDMPRIEEWMLGYTEHRGTLRFRTAVAEFLSHHFKAAKPLDVDNIIITTGGDCAMEFLLHSITDPGDCLLVPAPYYYSIGPNAGMRQHVVCHDLHLPTQESSDGPAYRITDDILEKGFEDATKQGKRVKAIIFVNPHNPTGTVYSRDVLQTVLQFASRHDLHVIVDEIYGLTIFGDEAEFHSVLELEEVPNPEKTHFMWGFSKDLCLPGFHTGVIYSKLKNLAASLNHLNCMASVPSYSQALLETLIQDTDWLENVYFRTYLSRLKESWRYAEHRLTKMGVKCHPAQAAYFIWADFTKYINSVDEEVAMCQKLVDGGVFSTPGTPMACQQPGWFRVTVAHPIPYLKTAMERLEKVLLS